LLLVLAIVRLEAEEVVESVGEGGVVRVSLSEGVLEEEYEVEYEVEDVLEVELCLGVGIYAA
jgi:hypothetical protein